MNIIDIFLPMLANYKCNKKIKKQINEYRFQPDIIEGFSEIPLDIVRDKYQESLNIKNKFEDKAKSNIVALTISISIMFGLSGVVSTIYAKLAEPYLQICFFIVVLASFIYMIIAGLMSISVVVNNNEIYALDYSDLIQNEGVVKQKYQEALQLNTLKNLIRNNTIFSSYECIRNSIICLLIIFIVSSFPIKTIENNEKIYESSTLSGYTLVYNLNTKLPENIEFTDIQKSIGVAITSQVLKEDNTITIYDKERGIQLKIFSKGKTITIVDVSSK